MLTLSSNLARKSSLQAPIADAVTPGFRSDNATVVIEYCAPGNYESAARDLARSIHDDCGAETRLVPSRDGVFEVTVAGSLIFSKRASWRLPESDEILYHVRLGSV